MELANDAAKARVDSTVYAWYVVAVLLLAQTSSFVDRMIMGLLVGPIRTTFQISDTQYSLLAGLAFSIFYCLMGFPLARIADRGSRRLLIGVGIAVWSLMTAACGLARSFWGLFVARVGVGVGEATLGPAAYSIITDYFSREMLARALSIYMIGVTLGSGIAYMVGGSVVQWVLSLGTVRLPLFGELYGWQPVFFLVGLPGLLVALLMRTVREPVRRGRLVSVSNTHLPVREVIAYVLQRRRAYGAHIIGISVYVMVVYALNLWGPTYLIRTFGYSTASAGWTFGAIMVGAGTLGLLTAGWIGDVWSARGRADAYPRIILTSMIVMVPFVVALGFLKDAAFALPVLSIAIFLSAIQGGSRAVRCS